MQVKNTEPGYSTTLNQTLLRQELGSNPGLIEEGLEYIKDPKKLETSIKFIQGFVADGDYKSADLADLEKLGINDIVGQPTAEYKSKSFDDIDDFEESNDDFEDNYQYENETGSDGKNDNAPTREDENATTFQEDLYPSASFADRVNQARRDANIRTISSHEHQGRRTEEVVNSPEILHHTSPKRALSVNTPPMSPPLPSHARQQYSNSKRAQKENMDYRTRKTKQRYISFLQRKLGGPKALDRMGISMNTPLVELEFEVNDCEEKDTEDDYIQCYKYAATVMSKVLEKGNKRLGPYMYLDGFTEFFTQEISDNDRLIRAVHRYYFSNRKPHPLNQLLWKLCLSFVFYSITKGKMARFKSKTSPEEEAEGLQSPPEFADPSREFPSRRSQKYNSQPASGGAGNVTDVIQGLVGEGNMGVHLMNLISNLK